MYVLAIFVLYLPCEYAGIAAVAMRQHFFIDIQKILKAMNLIDARKSISAQEGASLPVGLCRLMVA